MLRVSHVRRCWPKPCGLSYLESRVVVGVHSATALLRLTIDCVDAIASNDMRVARELSEEKIISYATCMSCIYGHVTGDMRSEKGFLQELFISIKQSSPLVNAQPSRSSEYALN